MGTHISDRSLPSPPPPTSPIPSSPTLDMPGASPQGPAETLGPTYTQQQVDAAADAAAQSAHMKARSAGVECMVKQVGEFRTAAR